MSDPKSEAIRAFNVLDTSHQEGSRFYGIPTPHVFVISKHGIIENIFSEEDYKQRPELSVVYDSLRRN